MRAAQKQSVPIENHAKEPYDAILASFKKKTESFHRKKYSAAKQAGNETEDQHATRLAEKRSEFNHLKQEAALAKAMLSVQIQLQEYRDKYCTQAYMLAEPHHPTGDLDKYLRMDGRPKPALSR